MSPTDRYPFQVAADASAHLETLALLYEAQQYLARLPANPMTHGLSKKLESHLADPHAAQRRQRLLEAQDAERHEATGLEGMTHFTPAGLPGLVVKLTGRTLSIRSPLVEAAGKKRQGAARQDIVALEQSLATGVTVMLNPPADTDPTQTAGLRPSGRAD